jgi:hypothetical protein
MSCKVFKRAVKKKNCLERDGFVYRRWDGDGKMYRGYPKRA